jgi:hypothetical protein
MKIPATRLLPLLSPAVLPAPASASGARPLPPAIPGSFKGLVYGMN